MRKNKPAPSVGSEAGAPKRAKRKSISPGLAKINAERKAASQNVVTTTVTIPEEMLTALTLEAGRRGVSRSSLVVEAIRDKLGRTAP